MMELFVFGLIACVLVGLNVKATILIARDTLSTLSQKSWQLALVWFVPVLGAIITLAVHKSVAEPSRRYRESLESGEGAALSGRFQQNLSEAIDGD
jgi:hypothetical protein